MPNREAAVAAANNGNSFGPCIDCISEINNTQIDNTKDLVVVIEYSHNYSKTSRILWQYCQPTEVNQL